MTKKRKYLKKQNLPQVTTFIIWCTAIYVVHLSSYSSFWEALHQRFAALSTRDSILVVMAPVLNTVLTGVLPAQLKAKLIFWRLRDPLPGHRVFTELAPKDARIDMNTLRQKLGELPISPKEQNTTWYSLFKKYEHVVTVENSHRNFLLTRDLASVSLIFAIMGTIGLVFAGVETGRLIAYFMIMGFHYLGLAIVARNHGNGLVCNVLAEYSTDT